MDEHIKLVVVDEQENYINSIKDYIDICNYSGKISVQKEDNIQKFLDKYSQNQDSLLIIDAFLEDTNSIELLNQARKKGVPTILVSDVFLQDIKESAISNGALAYFPKMYEVEELDPLFELVLKISSENQPFIIN